jgi:hypothetical protein
MMRASLSCYVFSEKRTLPESRSRNDAARMSDKQQTALSPRRDEDFPEWYQQVVRAADLAENR